MAVGVPAGGRGSPTGLRPGLVIVDGDEAITGLAVQVFGTDTPIQRCLVHLERQTRWMARYLDRLGAATADELQSRLHELLADAYATGDLTGAVAASNTLIDTAEALGADHAVTYLRNAAPHAFTFAAHPGARRLLLGDTDCSWVTRDAPSSQPRSSNKSCAR